MCVVGDRGIGLYLFRCGEMACRSVCRRGGRFSVFVLVGRLFVCVPFVVIEGLQYVVISRLSVSLAVRGDGRRVGGPFSSSTFFSSDWEAGSGSSLSPG